MSAVPFENFSAPALQTEGQNLEIISDPSRRSGSSSAMMARLEMMRACYGGTETMRQMGKIFLPQYPRETDIRYINRISSTFALNKLQEAVDSASAKPFRNLVTIDHVDDDMQNMMWNADLRGNHLHVVAHRFFNEAVLTGLSHILVDFPYLENIKTLQDQRNAKLRPYMRRVSPEDLLGCYTEQVGGETRVVHARIGGSRVQFNRSNYSEEVVDMVYVIEPGIIQIWERPRMRIQQFMNQLGPGASVISPLPIDIRYLPTPVSATGGGVWKLVSERRIDIDFVPLVTMTAGNEEADQVVKPIFQDLAYKQIEHWQSSSDQRNILSAGRFAMLAASGVQIDDTMEPITHADGRTEPGGQGFEIGPWKILTSPDPQGRWYYVEPQGNAIEAGAKDLDDLQMHMDMMALNPVMSVNRQYVPQNERSIAETRVNSVIHDLAIGCENALNNAIAYMGVWNGKDYSKARVRLNMDFSGTDEKAGNISAVLDAVAKGVLSREGALGELIRLDLLNDDFDIKAEVARQTATAELKANETNTTTETIDSKTSKSDRDFPNGQTRPNSQN